MLWIIIAAVAAAYAATLAVLISICMAAARGDEAMEEWRNAAGGRNNKKLNMPTEAERTVENCERNNHQIERKLSWVIEPYTGLVAECQTCGLRWAEEYSRTRTGILLEGKVSRK